MKKSFRKTLAYLLCILLVFTSLPLVAAAENATAQNNIENNDVNKPTEEPYIISELIEKRQSNIKHFRMSDGSINAVVYSEDVHFIDENNEFIDINNTLSEDFDGTDNVYSNENNIASVKFMKKSNPNKLYTIDKGAHKIKVSIEGVSKVNGVVETSESDILSKTQFALENIGSKITYSDILENTDFEYTLFSTELKENIILKEKVDFNSLIYSYHFNGSINAVQEDEKNIAVYEKESNNLIFNISAPVMWDAKGETFEDLALDILETTNSKIKVKISWNIPENFKYPVTIDPVMEFRIDRNSIQDTHIISAYPTTNYDVNNHIRIRNNGYAMVKFPTPSLTSGDKIINAELMLYPYGAFDTSSSVYSNENSYNPPLNITAHKILRAWEETTATYSNVNADNGFYESIVQSYRVVDGNNGFYKWDITRLVNEWTEGYSENHGVLLKYESPPSDGSMFDSFFCSTNGKFIDSNAWPRMVYQYINTTGVEDYFSYHTQNLGAAGTGYTNDLTGNLMVINPVLQTGGSLAPITVSLIYNSNNVNNAQTPYGTGWKLNWAQKIDWSVKSNFNNTQYVKYTDTDGTNHFFTVDNSTGIWTDEINPDRKVYFIESSGDYKMTDSSGTCMYFKRKGTLNEWYLYKTVDIYGNYIQLTLNSSNMNRVEKIYSSTGNEVNLAYNQYGFLTNIKYYDEGTEKNISIGYNGHVQTANNGISDIYYADGTSVQYHYYNTSKYLSKAVDISGQNITYNYTWKTPMRVNYVAEYSNNSELGNVMQMKYEATSTTFTDVTNNRKYLYTFAQNGTLKSVVDTTANDGNGYSQYYEYNNGNTTETTGTGNLTFSSKTQKNTVNLLQNHSFEKDGHLIYTAWSETVKTSSGGFSTEKSYIGSRSYKITRPSTSDCTRATGYYYTSVKGGKTYTFSAYVNTAQMVPGTKGVSLYALTSTTGYESEYITEATDEWRRLSVTFTPETDTNISLCMNLRDATGSVYFDCAQLEVGELSQYNLLENAGFESAIGTESYRWISDGAAATRSTAEYISGSYSARINSTINNATEVLQTLNIANGKKGDTYVASAFAKATSIPASGWNFSLLVRFHKGATVVNEENFLFDFYTTDWQKISGVAQAKGDYDTITFWFLYYNNCNTVYLDNAQLIKDTFGTSYTYDSKGNLLSTVDLEGKDEYTFKYNGNNQLIKESTISGGKILYSYNSSKKQQLDLVTAGGISTAYTYDSKGNTTSTSTMGTELIEGKSYYLQNVYYSKYLNVTNSGTASGTTVGLADFGKNSAQRWKLIKNTDGSYSLSPECATNKILSVNGSALANSVNLALYSSGEKTYQKFKLVKKSGNTYCLDIAENANYAIDCNGTNVYTYSMHHAEVQQFAFIPVANSNSSSNPAIISSATYSADGDYMTSVTDSRGNTTSYEYNEDRGYLKSETNANGVTTNYSYYNNELLKNVSVPNGTETPTVSYGYDSYKRLETITSPSGTVYGFTYDGFSRCDTVKVGTRTLSDYLYDSKGRVDTFTYGNGSTIKYGYDHLNRQTSTTINNVLRYNKVYDGHSRLLQIEDILLGKKVKYEYDILDRLVGERLINTATNNIFAQLNIRYDNTKNRVAGYDINIEGINKATDFVYGENKVAPDIITSVKHNGAKKLSYGYDSLNRLSSRTLATQTPFVTEYTYLQGASSDKTTALVSSIKNGDDTISYTYDDIGNIKTIEWGGSTYAEYTYDNLNQLIAVNDAFGDDYTYTYDNNGNILTAKYNDTVTKTYTYGNSEWKDLLTAYNDQTITYDDIGNPLSYRDGMSFTWADGRKLATVTKGTDNISYTYDSSGLRTSKTVEGNTTEYYWLNGMLQGQKTGSEYIVFLHDENGTAYGFLLKNGTTEEYYYYIFNAQGDIIGILDSTGTKVVEYNYNVWGEVLSITGTLADTIGQKNPLRYRGYYFDSETNFYYLQSRYYDPVIGRFINADGVLGGNLDILANNLFAYCSNNPINNSDTTGQWKMPNWLKVTIGATVLVGLAVVTVATLGTGTAVIAGAALVGGTIGGTVGAVSGYKTGGWSGAATGFMTGTISGAASGALAASGGGYVAQMVGGGLINASSNLIKNTENVEKISIKPLATDFIVDFGIGTGGGIISGRGFFNSKGTLNAAIDTFDSIVSREIRRTNAMYSSKVIASAIKDYNQAWFDNVLSTSIRFIGATAFVEIFGD